MPPAPPRPARRVPAFFFRTASGAEPVREWLKSLPPAERRAIGEDIKTVEWGWPLGMPLCRPMGQGLHEVRTRLANRIARVLFYVDRHQQMVLLHGFIKKTEATSARDLDLALARKAEHERG